MSLKINSIDRSVFANTINENDRKVRVNGKEISRNDIIATGRLVACEYVGKKLNFRPNIADKYSTRLNGVNYEDFSKAHSDKKFMFCAATAYQSLGKEAPQSIEEAKKDLSLSKDIVFLRTMAAIDKDIIQPLIFRVYDDIASGGLMQWEAIPIGETKEITVRSNDVFLFEDSSWGSGRSSTYNYLYSKTVTLNPKMYTTQAKLKWYQDIVNGEAGSYYAAIMNGMWNKIYAIFMSKLADAASNVNYIPAGLTATSYSTSNWNKITSLVAAANGVKRSDLVAFGNINALCAVLPTDGTGGAITGLQYALGEEWFRRGFLQNAGGVQLIEVEPAIIPGTQNSTLDTIDMGNNIYIAAKGGIGTAPIYAGYYEGSPITLEISPSDAADFSVNLNVGAMFDFKPVFASKVGVITNVNN